MLFLTRLIRTKVSLFIITVITLITGCSGYLPNLPENYDVSSDKEKGVIIGSVGTLSFYRQWREWARYDYASLSDAKIHGHVTSAVNLSNPFYPQPECPDDGLAEECAYLFAIILPAGKYKFWSVIPAMDSQIADPAFKPIGWSRALYKYDFEVKAGKVTYIGNLLSKLCDGTSHSYLAIARIGEALTAGGDVGDMFSRDLPLLLKKFPQLINTEILNETMKGKPWIWHYKKQEYSDYSSTEIENCLPKRKAFSLSQHKIR